MSKLRSVNTHFWQDNYIIDLDPIEKLLFLYLLTNPQTNMLGIYELHIRRISFDTGIDKDMVLKIFDRFTKAGKVKYKDGYVILSNFLKNQSFNGNMETSAIKTWNDMPLSIREDDFCKPILKGLKGFTKGSEPIAEIEYELERELEEEPALSETEHDALEVCEHLLSAITHSDPDHRYNSNPPDIKSSSWLKEVDRAIRLDGRNKEDLMHLVTILFYDTNNVSEFWRPNVESGKKLRSQFDKIRGQLQRLPKFKQTNHDKFINQLFA